MGSGALWKSEPFPELSRGHPLHIRAWAQPYGSSLSRHPEVPHDPYDRHDGAHVHEKHVDGHHPGPDSANRRGLKLLRRFALVTTVTELNAMAAPAMTGDKRMPKKG